MSPALRVVTVVLAAGVGKRLGGPKALLAWPVTPGPQPPGARGVGAGADRPLAVAHAEERLAAESRRVLVVTRPPVVKVLLAYVRPGLDLLSSDAADDLGAAGSLAFAVPRLGDVDIVVVTPVDTPPARAATVARLLAALAADSALLAARPVCHGRAGHPVALRLAALQRYTEPGPPPLRDHLLTLGAACAAVDVTDPTVLIDSQHPGRRDGHAPGAAALLQVIPLVTRPAWGRVRPVKREKRLTKREQKALKAPTAGAKAQQQGQHIHCIACGRHLEAAEFDPPTSTARMLRCQHGSQFPSCVACVDRSRVMIATHDRTNRPVAQAEAWH